MVAAAAAILIAVIGLIASVHYRLGKLEQGQENMAANQEKGDIKTREMVDKRGADTLEMMAREFAHTRELLMQELAAQRERSDAQHAETIGAIQRLTDGSLPHSHDQDGSIRFRVPPPDQQQPLPTDDGP